MASQYNPHSNSFLKSLTKKLSKSPHTAGVGFLVFMVFGTYGLSFLTQTKVDYDDLKRKSFTEEDDLELRKNAKPFNLQETYFNLTKNKEFGDDEDWDYVRVPRYNGKE